jgi:large subunit ribosomal protein L29
MDAQKIKELNPEEQAQKLSELKEAYFKLRFQHGTGQLENTSALKRTRRNIARVKTAMNAQRS